MRKRAKRIAAWRDGFMQKIVDEIRSERGGEKKEKTLIGVMLSLQKQAPEIYTDRFIKAFVVVSLSKHSLILELVLNKIYLIVPFWLLITLKFEIYLPCILATLIIKYYFYILFYIFYILLYIFIKYFELLLKKIESYGCRNSPSIP